jgi:KaiC/GvpD/RAD55 family RecA-like ATPase
MLAGLRFPNGTISYIGARPGGGKSTLFVNLTREALSVGRNVFLINLEMLNRAVITNYTLSLMYATADVQQRQELYSTDHPMSKYYSLFRRESDSRETFDSLRQTAMKKHLDCLIKNYFFMMAQGKP